MLSRLVIFSGKSNPALAERICQQLGVPPGRALVGRFSDGEVRVEIQENVRGKEVFIVQSTSPPINENFIELLVMVDALKRASAGRITAVVPYYGYARKDKKEKPRVSVTAKLVADLITVAGTDRVVTVDLHADQIQGFFKIPVEHLHAIEVLMDDVKTTLQGNEVVVAPDAGGVERARIFANALKLDLAILDHRRTESDSYSHIVGDVRDRRVIILDDMVDTGRTLDRTIRGAALAGASQIDAYCVHAVLSMEAVKRLDASPLRSLTVMDSVPLHAAASSWGKIRQVSMAPMLAEVIRHLNYEESVSSLFKVHFSK